MADTLLSIVQKACGRIGNIDVPTSVVGNPDTIVGQMLALANEEGEELLRAYDWSALVIEGASFGLVPDVESYTLPADFDRLVGGTQWDRTNKWRTMGPDGPQDARRRREGIVDNGPRRALRQVGNAVTVWPIPGSGDAGAVLAYDYVSTGFCASGGVRQPQWLADTDVPILRADLMVLGLKWRWRFAQGLEAASLREDYDRAVRLATARDHGGGQTINLAGPRWRDDRGNCDDVFARGPSATLGTTGGDGIAID